METLEEKIARVVKEKVAVVPYNPRWRDMFEQERRHLLSCLPQDLVKRIEHLPGPRRTFRTVTARAKQYYKNRPS